MALGVRLRVIGASTLLAPMIADAHAFGQMYNLPIPLWLYMYGSAATLLISFLIIAWFSKADAAAVSPVPKSPRLLQGLRNRYLLIVLRTISFAALVLTILSGLLGNQNAYANFSMTWFWIIFMLGFTYLTALLGDFYREINPWLTLVQLIGRAWPRYPCGRKRYPEKLAHWPALIFFMMLIVIELYGRFGPQALALMLLAYTLITLTGVAWSGSVAWFRYCELFSVLLGLVARMAPIDWSQPRLSIRAPFSGLRESMPQDYSLVVFILFFLSSTTFDGLHATFLWYGAFWNVPLQLLQMHYGAAALPSYYVLRDLFEGFGSLCLLLSPFLYLAVYLLALEMMRRLGRSALTRRELALRFAPSLLPIALAYNITHYFILLITQGPQIVRLLSDPFGFGWNLFGTSSHYFGTLFPNMAVVWHVQVALILLGHIASVFLAHGEALRCFPRKEATISQLPMLALMIFLTGFGLWILALPMQGGA